MRRLSTILVGMMMLAGCISDRALTNVELTELKPGAIVPQLRVGVKVRISVSASGQTVLEETVKEVSASGDITLDLINSVKCAGMTIEAFQEELTTRYREFYLEPLVTAYYVPMNEGGSSPYGSVLVTGCVKNEGVVNIPQTCDLTVMQALQKAGGMGQWANKNRVLLTRSLSDGTRQQVTIDTERIGARGATDLNLILMPGDVLHVPESNW